MNNLNHLPDEIVMEIILKLKSNDMLNINVLSRKFHQLIKSYNITNNSISHTIKLNNYGDINEKIKILTKEYNFKKYNLTKCDKITDESVKLLTGLHTLDLTCCERITDESVKLLTGLHTLNL